jgi:hypothetical protein
MGNSGFSSRSQFTLPPQCVNMFTTPAVALSSELKRQSVNLKSSTKAPGKCRLETERRK